MRFGGLESALAVSDPCHEPETGKRARMDGFPIQGMRIERAT